MPAFDLSPLLAKAKRVLAVVAPLTPTKIDDALLGLIDAIEADATLKAWFGRKVDDDHAGVLSLESEPPAELAVVLQQRQIDWARLIELAPVLIQLVKLLRGA